MQGLVTWNTSSAIKLSFKLQFHSTLLRLQSVNLINLRNTKTKRQNTNQLKHSQFGMIYFGQNCSINQNCSIIIKHENNKNDPQIYNVEDCGRLFCEIGELAPPTLVLLQKPQHKFFGLMEMNFKHQNY